MIAIRIVICLLFLLARHVAPCYSVEYHVQWATTGPSTTSGSIPQAAFNVKDIDHGISWRSIAARGGATLYFDDDVAQPMRAFHIKTKNKEDTFIVDPPPVGKTLFKQVWQSPDGREVIFNAGLVQVSETCYSKVYPQTPHNGTSKVFLGRVSDQAIPVPSNADWATVYDELGDEQDPVLRRLFEVCPSRFANIDVYGVSSDAKFVCFISNGMVFVYDDDKRLLQQAVIDTFSTPINRISEGRAAQQGFDLWKNGVRQLGIDLKDGKFRPVLDQRDHKHK